MLSQKGFLLITLISIVAVLSLVILVQMQALFLDYKLANSSLQKNQVLSELEEVAKELSSLNFIHQDACKIPASDPNEILQSLKNNLGCSLVKKEKRFNYLMEDLGEFPCLQILKNKKFYGTQHFRLSLQLKESILQIRIAKMISKTRCNSISQTIHRQLLSWRYLPLG